MAKTEERKLKIDFKIEFKILKQWDDQKLNDFAAGINIWFDDRSIYTHL